MTHDDAAIVVTEVGGEASALLAAIHQRCFARGWDSAAFAKMMSIPGTLVFVASANAGKSDDIAGFAMARITFEQCEILALGVLSETRRRGVGGALVDRVCARATEAGVAAVLLEVADDNTAAQALYRSRAFTAAGLRPNYYRDEGRSRDAIVMRRELTAMPRQA